MAEYVHRCGRTGRLSSKKPGTVTNLISGRNEVSLVQKIEVRKLQKIHVENLIFVHLLIFLTYFYHFIDVG